jgi:hypothetical protein
MNKDKFNKLVEERFLKIEKVRHLMDHFIRNNKLSKLAKNTAFDKSLFKRKK